MNLGYAVPPQFFLNLLWNRTLVNKRQFLAHDAMLVPSRSFIKTGTAGWIEAIVGTESTLHLSYTAFKGNLDMFKNKGTFQVWNLVPKDGTSPSFLLSSPQHVHRRTCCRLSLTDNCRQLITLSAHLCLFKLLTGRF